MWCGFEFQLQSGERGAGLRRIERTGEEFLLAGAGLVGPDGAGAAGLTVE
jgi:hypothetical protein